MKNNEALVVLSDAIDLQRETVALLREALAALNIALDELKAARNPVITLPPTYAPYTQPQQPSWPTPCVGPTRFEPIDKPSQPRTITCEGTGVYTSEAKDIGVFYSNTGVSLDGGRTICGKRF